MNRRPGRYYRTNGVPTLIHSAVLFLDVLGTKELANGVNAASTLVRLDSALERARERSQLDESWNWADSSWFSDNLAIAAPLGTDRVEQEGVLGTVIVAAMWLQYLLAIDGFFTRGGLTVGEHFMDDRTNFGPALVRAVELDNRKAIYPRIILDDDAVAVVEDHASDYAPGADNPFEAHLAVDEHGATFISYLAVAYEADDTAEATWLLEQHRDAVLLKLREHGSTGAVGEKYAWTAEYHNAFCQMFDRRQGSLLIEPSARTPSFRRFAGPST